MLNPNQDQQLRELAAEMGMVLYRRYTEAEAAEFIGIHPQTLKQKRLAGEIAFVKIGSRTIQYFGYQITEFLLGSIEWHNPRTLSTDSAKSGSRVETAATRSTDIGGTASEAAQDALRLARQSLKKPSSD